MKNIISKANKKVFYENLYNLLFISILTGLFAGVVVTLYSYLTSFAEHSAVHIYTLLLAHPAFIPLLFFVLGVGAIVIGTWVKLVPMIRGSGIPQIEGAARGIVHFKWYITMCSMFAASLACMFLGLSAGGEGPSLEMGGCAGVATSSLLKRSQMVKRLQTASGAAAGFAVAFNAPITGLVFAMEEAFRSFSAQVFLSASVSVISALLVRYGLGLALGMQIGFTFSNFVFTSFQWDMLLWVLIAAVIVGLLGVVFYYVMLVVKQLLKKVTFLHGIGKFLIPFMLAGAFGLITPYAMGGGHDFIQALATGGTGTYTLERVFGSTIFITLIVIVLFKFIASVLAMGCGVPCGVFIPMLAIGAGEGAILSLLFQKLGMPAEYADYLVVICMCVYFTTIVKAPVTGIVMVFELTGQFQNFLPALLGIAIGFLIAELFGTEPLYEKCLASFIEEEQLYKGAIKRRVQVKIQPFSHADGGTVRKIIWPTNSLVVELIHENGDVTVPDGETILVAGDTITVECEIASEEDLYTYLYEIVGKP
jgi:H+/Cl- antiporter ClcA